MCHGSLVLFQRNSEGIAPNLFPDSPTIFEAYVAEPNIDNLEGLEVLDF